MKKNSKRTINQDQNKEQENRPEIPLSDLDTGYWKAGDSCFEFGEFDKSIPILETLKGVEATLRKHFEIQDWQGVRIILAGAAAHYLSGEMLWLRVIGGSGSGRTELLLAILADPDSEPMENVTPAALRGGLKGGVNLLKKLDGKRVITKDLAAVMSRSKDTRLELFGVLRGVKDGFTTADFGTQEGRVQRRAHFDWILATTPIVEMHRQIESMLGERFVDLRWRPGHREEMAYKAQVNNPKLLEIRKELATSVCSLLARVRKVMESSVLQLSREDMRLIAKWADSTSLCRSPVSFEKGHILRSIPAPEVGTRLAQDFSRIALGLKLIGIEDWQPYVQRLVWDCIPSARAIILARLQRTPAMPKRIAEDTTIPLKSVYYYLEQLRLLNVVKAEAPDKLLLEDVEDYAEPGRMPEVYSLNISLPESPFSKDNSPPRGTV